LFLILCFFVPGWAQPGTPAAPPVAAQPEVPKDALGRGTPRGAVLGFLTSSRKGDTELAVEYLNTRQRGTAGAKLAHQLFTILDLRLPPKLNELSDKAEGSLSNPLKPDQELVGTIRSDNGDLDIYLERVNRGNSGGLWLFSSKTLQAIPNFYEANNFASVDDRVVLPAFLTNTRFFRIPLFEWLAVLVAIPLYFFLAALLSRGLNSLASLLLQRIYRKRDLTPLDFLPHPLRLLFLAALIRWMVFRVSLPLLARQFWSTVASIITITACVWLLMHLSRWGEEALSRRMQSRNIAGATLMLRLARRVTDLLIVFAGLLVVLYYFGVDPTAALTGLGVGGIAVALAAQKTLENVIGGASVIFDRTLSVGDTIKAGDTLGIVQHIGLRSTQIRTLDRTIVSVPNGQIAGMIIENLSSRDKFRIHSILALRYGTTSPQMYSILDGIRTLLKQSRYVESASVRARLIRFGPASLDIEVQAYVLTVDLNHFLEIQEALLLQIVECVESAGVQMAFPLHKLVDAASGVKDAA
jgi:MscS family membrane protein